MDELNIDTYFKTLAYANLYKANASAVDGIKADDITITIVRREKPVKLFEWFAVHGYEVEETYRGIYYVKSHDFYAIQIVASRELSKAEHTWLMALTDDMEQSDARRLVQSVEANMRNFNIDLETACRGNDITVEEYKSAKELLAGIEKKDE